MKKRSLEVFGLICSLKQKQQLKTKQMQSTKHKNLNIVSFDQNIQKKTLSLPNRLMT